MATNRYLNYNTHIIDPLVDSGNALEFLDLRNIDLIEKLPFKDSVDIFYKDTDKNILHGSFLLGKNEYYEGSARVISYSFFSDIENIYIKPSFYKPSKYFYFFYEREYNIYLRTYKQVQGSLDEEILVLENAKIKNIKNIKENFIFIIEDQKDKSILEHIKTNQNGELKMMFLYENDITRLENKEEEILNIQLFDIPFNDIPEQFYLVENEVENDKGKLYLSGSNSNIKENKSAINGKSCINYGTMVTEMDHQNEFTIIIRLSPKSGEEGLTLFSTDTFELKYYYDKFKLVLSNGHSIDFTKNVVDEVTTIFPYNTIVFSVSNVGDKFWFNLGNSNSLLSVDDYLLNTQVYINKDFFIDEKFFKVHDSYGIDYLAIKNTSTNLNTIKDLLICFDDNLFKLFVTNNITFNADDIESQKKNKIQEVYNRSVHVMPDDVSLVNIDIMLTEDDNNKSFNVVYPAIVTCNEYVRTCIIYLNEYATFINTNMNEVTIFAKANSIVDANHKNLIIYHEQTAFLTNVENCTLVYVKQLYFSKPDPTGSLFSADSYLPPDSSRTLTETYSEIISAGAVSLSSTTIAVSSDNVYGNIYSVFNDEIGLGYSLSDFDSSVDQISGVCTQDLIPLKRFIDLDDGTLLDAELNIIWSKTPIYVSQVIVETLTDNSEVVKYLDSYALAKFEIENTYIGNKSDWRMCTQEELTSITDYLDSSIVDMTLVPKSNIYGDSFSECTTNALSGAPYYSTITGDEDNGYLTDKLLFNKMEITSGVFDTDFYNSFEPTALKPVRSDSIWVQEEKIYSIYNKAFYDNDKFNGCPATLAFPVRKVTPEYGLYLQYTNGYKFLLPKTKGDIFGISNKNNSFRIVKSHKNLELLKYEVTINSRRYFNEAENIKYIEHEHTNSNNRYIYGTEVFLNRNAKSKECGKTVFPIKLLERFNFHKHLFIKPENNIRICNHFKQRDGLIPFKIEYDSVVDNVMLWTTLSSFDDKIGFQYDLQSNNIFTNPYDDYNIFNKRVYSQTEYFSAFHFNKLINCNRKLINEITIDDNGELMLIGSTNKNKYIREINNILFFGLPQKYKSSSINLELDVANIKNTQSYINNYDVIRLFVEKIIKQWIPTNVIVEDIIEKETLVMAKLLQDEYIQVLVGLTPLDNFNAYYNRTVDSREVMLKSSSNVTTDQINWVGIPQLNTPYLKSGVTKVIKEKKNLKVTFNTRYTSDKYRAFVFSPYDAKFYIPTKNNDGFIIESSSTVRDEVSWITINSTEVVNGTIKWKKGVPNGDLIENNFDRILEISKHSNTYTLDFTTLGFPAFEDSNYSVILATNKNVNVWVENKRTNSFTVRRSYVGDDLDIDFFVVKGNQKWWQGITS